MDPSLGRGEQPTPYASETRGEGPSPRVRGAVPPDQWQREACARALYRQPGLLFLDEPTSQMDPRGEHHIFEEIKSIAADRITIVVTHRLENTKDR